MANTCCVWGKIFPIQVIRDRDMDNINRQERLGEMGIATDIDAAGKNHQAISWHIGETLNAGEHYGQVAYCIS